LLCFLRVSESDVLAAPKSLVSFGKCQDLACILGRGAGRADKLRSNFLALGQRCGVKRSEHDKSRLIKKSRVSLLSL